METIRRNKSMSSKRSTKKNVFAEENIAETQNEILAEETAEQTNDAVAEESAVEDTATQEVAAEVSEESEVETAAEHPEESTTESVKADLKVVCDKLYLRPEPNKKGAPLGILEEGNLLKSVKSDAKLPVGWIEVTTAVTGVHGYVMEEFVKSI